MNVGGAARQTGALSSVPFLRIFLGYPFCRGMLPKGYSIGSILRLGSPRAGYGREACMKRVLFALATGLLSTQAFAADLPMPAPPPRAPAAYIPVAPPFSWTGIYIGGNVGAAWNRGTVSDAANTGFTLPSNNAVFTGGGQIGPTISSEPPSSASKDSSIGWRTRTTRVRESSFQTVPPVALTPLTSSPRIDGSRPRLAKSVSRRTIGCFTAKVAGLG
jgi:hypothetical protein